ncbi:hypothetical protein, partial [Mesorhizobium silamurunense]|uniref:hypothetical protein n=1 Tax=Mesorhizobium silamurunense TaxID=499528 RepID=UPI001AEDA6F5
VTASAARAPETAIRAAAEPRRMLVMFILDLRSKIKKGGKDVKERKLFKNKVDEANVRFLTSVLFVSERRLVSAVLGIRTVR